MANPAGRVNAVFGRYASLIEKEIDRWENAADEAQARLYTADKLASDVVGCWTSMAEAWTFPLALWKSGGGKVFFRLKTTDKTAMQTVAVAAGGAFEVEPRGDLVHDDGASAIPAANVKAQLSSDGGSLAVSLAGLANLKVGIYTGEIVRKSDKSSVAPVVVRVEQA